MLAGASCGITAGYVIVRMENEAGVRNVAVVEPECLADPLACGAAARTPVWTRRADDRLPEQAFGGPYEFDCPDFT